MTVVVKIGGARAVDPKAALTDVATLVEAGKRVIVVHGGSTAVDDMLTALGREPEYVTTPNGITGRFTDDQTMDVFTMVMAGKLNTALTVALRAAGVDAVGLSGVDGGLLTGPRKSAVRVIEDGKKKIKRGDHSGRITDVNVDLLELVLDAGYTPIVSVPMLADDGVAVNTDADRSAAAITGAMNARLVILTDVVGVFEDPADPTTVIDTVDTPAALERTIDVATGFMSKKVMATIEALDGGAREVVIADANADQPIVSALSGTGTRFTPGAVDDREEVEI